jgi:ASCH domain
MLDRSVLTALTVRQPWAWAITHGQKNIENRTWTTCYRGPLAIHAGSRWDEDGATDARVITAVQREAITPSGTYDPPLRVILNEHRDRVIEVCCDNARFALGAIVAVAVLTDVHRPGRCTSACAPWGISSSAHWVLDDVRPLEVPVTCRGRLGLWSLPAAAATAVFAQMGAPRA